MHKKVLERERHKRVAEELGKGACISKAMVAAGYSRGQAKRGTAALPQGVFHEMAKQGQSYTKLGRLGRLFKPEQRADIGRGALLQNVLSGKDRAARSIELMLRDNAVGVLKTDNNTVNVQINLPPGLEALFPELAAPQTIDMTGHTKRPTFHAGQEASE
jgi:hypothetical protein